MKKNTIQRRVSQKLKLFSDQLDEFELKLENHFTIKSSEFRTKKGIELIVDKLNNNQNPKLYKFTLESKSQRESLIEEYRRFQIINKARENKERLSISRFNDRSMETLYIGSKMKNIKARIKQHLGEGYYKTYAMQLNRWDSNLNYILNLEVYSIETTIEQNLKRNFIELIEQELWEEYKPVFGKKSGL